MSYLILYKNTQLKPEYNYAIDDIEDYLDSFLPDHATVIDDFQYIRHSLALTIKVNLAQSEVNPIKASTDSYNYASIDGIYYFIVRKTQISQMGVEFTLKMDTINTFKYGSAYSLSNRTLINRQHKNRFIKKNETEVIEVPQDEEHRYYDEDLCQLIAEAGTFPLMEIDSFSDILSEQKIGMYDFGASDRIQILRIKKDNLSVKDYLISSPAYFIIQKSDDLSLHITAYDEDGVDYDSINLSAVELEDYYLSIITNSDEFSVYMENGAGIPTYDTFSNYLVKYIKTNSQYYRNIDFYSEGLNPILYQTNKQEINIDNLEWYLIYKNHNEISETLSNPVDCFLCASEDLLIRYDTIHPTISTENMLEGYFYFLKDTGVYIDENGNTYQNILPYNLIARKNNGRIQLYSGNIFSDNLTIVFQANVLYLTRQDSESFEAEYIDFLPRSMQELLDEGITHTFGGALSEITLKSINSLDRTDAKLIKIIKLPYAPVKLNKDLLGRIIVPEDFEYDTDSQFLRLLDLSKKFDYEFKSEINPIELLKINLDTIARIESKKEKYESKLFHSDYYKPKMLYDSFGFEFNLEKIDIDYYSSLENKDFIINYSVTSTINSRFMFTFSSYTNLKATQDFPNILYVARNNEITLYNQQYINYLRTGFNYDVKSKTRQEVTSIVSTGLQLVGAVASFLFGGPIGAVAGVSLLTSATMSTVNTVNTIAQAEQNLETKQTQLKNQATAVYGADDIDLMSKYGKNRLLYTIYSVSDKMKKALFDMFYFTGYVGGYMAVPDTTSRQWFNFVSCNPVIEGANNIPEECLDDIRSKWQEGITFMHKYNGQYDFNRQYENWENDLFL